MIALARNNAAKKGLKPPHVSFVQASLVEPLPIESESVDCILSNCVINLLPLEGKAKIFKEMHRILNKGGRVVLDDVNIVFLVQLLHNRPDLFLCRSSRRNLCRVILRRTSSPT